MANIPSIYTSKQRKQMKKAILARLGEGTTLTAVCRENGMPPHRTVYYWLENDKKFREAYNIALQTPCKAFSELHKRDIKRELCERVSLGETLPTICRDLGVSERVIFDWLRKDVAFDTEYQQARLDMADSLVDKVLDTNSEFSADDHGMARNMLNARMWAAEKLNPKKYSAAQRVELTAGFTPLDELTKVVTGLEVASLPVERSMADILAIADRQ